MTGTSILKKGEETLGILIGVRNRNVEFKRTHFDTIYSGEKLPAIDSLVALAVCFISWILFCVVLLGLSKAREERFSTMSKSLEDHLLKLEEVSSLSLSEGRGINT